VVQRIADRGAIDIARRALWNVSQVMKYAMVKGLVISNPASDLSEALPSAKPDHFAAITEPASLGELLRAIEGYEGTPAVHVALRLAPMLVVRPKELRHMEWSELEFEADGGARWSILGDKMKSGEPHIVPLASQAVEILRELEPLTGGGQYVFPNARSMKRPMSEVAVLAVLAALRPMGFESGSVTGHGFRATFRTLADEVLGEPVHLIEQPARARCERPAGACIQPDDLPSRTTANDATLGRLSRRASSPDPADGLQFTQAGRHPEGCCIARLPVR
jgi:integrase